MAEELKVGDSVWDYHTTHFPHVQQGTISYVGKNHYGETTCCIAKFLTSSGWEEREFIFLSCIRRSKEELKKATLDHIDWQIETAEKEIEKLRKEREDFLKEIGE